VEAASTDAEDMTTRLRGVTTGSAMDILRGVAAETLLMRDVRPIFPVTGPVVGRARTLRFLPIRSDKPTPPVAQASRALIEDARPGDVLVFDTARGLGGSVLGDMLALRAAERRVVAVVTDGHVRDVAEIAEIGLPVFARGTWPISYAVSLIPWESDVPVQCGGALVFPGDWIIADQDGVIVLPHAYARQVAQEAPQRDADDAESRRRLSTGRSLDEAYPLPKAPSPTSD
jgi:regulator of RNase E activity RraA